MIAAFAAVLGALLATSNSQRVPGVRNLSIDGADHTITRPSSEGGTNFTKLRDIKIGGEATGNWEAEMQMERLKAPISELPNLIEKHREIYRKNGVIPENSPYWPYGQGGQGDEPKSKFDKSNNGGGVRG